MAMPQLRLKSLHFRMWPPMDEKKKKKPRLRWGMQAGATGATEGASLHLETEESLDKPGSSIFWYPILRGY